MRVIGPQRDRTEFETDPARAFRRARALDAMLSAALPPPRRGVFCGTFADFARDDEQRVREAACRLERIQRELGPEQ
jgi:hypothetical protein